MKVIETAYAVSIFIGMVLIGCFVYFCWMFTQTALDSIPSAVFTVVGASFAGSVSTMAIGTAGYFVKWLSFKSRQIHHKGGLYPHVHDGVGYINLNEQGAQTVAALALGGKINPSVSAKIADRLVAMDRRDPALIPGPAADQQGQLTLDEIMAFDPRTSPHWLLVGKTGSGKSTAAYAILSQLNRLHNCEFIVMEPGGVNWGKQAAATKTAEIADVIIKMKEELERRQGLLREHDSEHVADLPQPLPYIVLVTEEMDSVFDDLRLTERAARSAAIVALRAIARMGRKAGICLVAVSQSGTSDVFDAHVRKNLSNVLLFKSEHTVSETWRIGERLSDLPPGKAYSVAHGDFVQFPRHKRPQLTIKKDYAAACTGATVAPVVTVVSQDKAVVPRLERGCEPDEQLAAELRRLHNEGMSKTKLCEMVWGFKDGSVFSVLNRILSA